MCTWKTDFRQTGEAAPSHDCCDQRHLRWRRLRLLACDYRVAGFADAIKIGLPEVKLGILPGFGGCVRLPKRIGIAKALSMILPGKLVTHRH